MGSSTCDKTLNQTRIDMHLIHFIRPMIKYGITTHTRNICSLDNEQSTNSAYGGLNNKKMIVFVLHHTVGGGCKKRKGKKNKSYIKDMQYVHPIMWWLHNTVCLENIRTVQLCMYVSIYVSTLYTSLPISSISIVRCQVMPCSHSAWKVGIY